jgi:hypothetical protein
VCALGRFKGWMWHPPQSLDDFFEAMQGLREPVWDAGPPLWEAESEAEMKPGVPVKIIWP